MPHVRTHLNPDRTAIVSLSGPEWGRDSMARAALFVYPTARGFGWVEPGYLDPIPYPMPCDHQWEGRIVQGPDGFSCKGPRGRAIVLGIDVADGRSGIYQWARDAFEDARRIIESRGCTFDEEREEVRKCLAELLS